MSANHSILELAQLEETRQGRSCADGARNLAAANPAADVAVEQIGSGHLVYAGRGVPWNQVAGVGVGEPVTESDIDRMVDFYESRGAEPKIEVPTVAHETLLAGLAARGFVVREFEHILMREIDPHEDFESTLQRPRDPGLKIRLMDKLDESEVLTCCDLITAPFRPPGTPCDGHWFEGSAAFMRLPRSFSFIATIDGVDAGAASMEARAPAAAMFGAATRSEFRRRGIQSSLIIERLEVARREGCSVVSIHSAPGIPTERNAIRAGFSFAYAKAVLVRPGSGLTPS